MMLLNTENLWYNKHPLRWLLWPMALIYQALANLRRIFLQQFCQVQFSVPIIVVGNLTVGGVGKTPLVIALAKAFQAKGLRVGIISRGYRASINKFPHEVAEDDNAYCVGDEPLLIAKKTGCPVVIAPKRVQAAQYLLDKHHSQIILSDDGLQHYAMGRALEIVVIDGVRQLGNGMCLPAGPLRESVRRLQKSDLVVVNEGQWPNAYTMRLQPGELTQLTTGQEIAVQHLPSPVAAIAAIGHPQRFFNTLQGMGLTLIKYAFPDHHHFQVKDLQLAAKTVVMTEKDAVKCQFFAVDSWYYLPVEAKLSDSFWQALWSHEQLKGYI